MPEDKWETMDDICDYLSVSRDTLLRWIKNDNMPAVKIGRLWRFRKSEIDEWLEQKNERLKDI